MCQGDKAMNKKRKSCFSAALIAAITIGIASSTALAGGLLDLKFSEAQFSAPPSLIIDNEYWPLRPDSTPRVFTYIGESEDECVIDQISVNDIMYGATYIMGGAAPYGGLEVVQVVDTEWVFEELPDGVECDTDLLLAEDAEDAIAELTLDWYLEDDQDNVWYVGEYSQSFEDECGEFDFDPTGSGIPDECKEGSWEAGVIGGEGDDAVLGEAGIVVPGNEPVTGEPLTPGTFYLQEVAFEAEDMAKILKLDASVHEAFPEETDYEGCRKVKEWNPFEHGSSVEHKWYCSGPGLVLIEGIGGGPTEVEELVDISPPLP
jgi:hypothetical protein